ncbi:MAG: hypothetical protein ISN28_10020 [Ectothiorhodospiraceae bacterium AqS1]|nr:hypothetical protein [Ectothiorhodospiraceae bacterium AqS1]
MKFQLTEFEQRFISKMLAVIAIIIGAIYGLNYMVEQYTAEERTRNENLKSQEADYRQRLAAIQDEERLQNQYIESYINYRDSNLIVGSDVGEESELANQLIEERRITLLQRLQQIQRDRNFYEVGARLTRPENLPPSFSNFTQESDVAVRTNSMKITMDMLHSLDMLMLLNDFYDSESNRFIPVQCAVNRKTGSLQLSADELLVEGAKLGAECDLVWLIVYDPKQGQVS